MDHQVIHPDREEAGSVLVLALLVTMVILGVGLTAIMLSSSGMKVSGNIARRQEALGAAETGLERALGVLRSFTGDWDPLLARTNASYPCGTPSLPADPIKGEILCDGAEALENRSVLGNLPPAGTSGTPQEWQRFKDNQTYTVYIRNDPLDMPAANPPDDNDRRVVIRAEGRGRDGLSFFAIEAMVSIASGGPGSAGMTEQHLGGPTGSHSYKGTAISPPGP